MEKSVDNENPFVIPSLEEAIDEMKWIWERYNKYK